MKNAKFKVLSVQGSRGQELGTRREGNHVLQKLSGGESRRGGEVRAVRGAVDRRDQAGVGISVAGTGRTADRSHAAATEWADAVGSGANDAGNAAHGRRGRG